MTIAVGSAVADQILDERFDRVALEPIGSLAGFGEFDQFYGRRADVHTDQRRRLRLQECKRRIEFFLQHGNFRRTSYKLH
jgi:hypothetical protein